MKKPESPFTGGDQPAVLRYLSSGDYDVMVPGRFVVCAVTGERIPITHLRYWNADLQEAYRDGEAATRRMAERAATKADDGREDNVE
ncbi:MAG: DUF2093 domain-containing protein [Sphingomonadales bacterium]